MHGHDIEFDNVVYATLFRNAHRSQLDLYMNIQDMLDASPLFTETRPEKIIESSSSYEMWRDKSWDSKSGYRVHLDTYIDLSNHAYDELNMFSDNPKRFAADLGVIASQYWGVNIVISYNKDTNTYLVESAS